MGHGVAILSGLWWSGGDVGDLEARPLTPHLVDRNGVRHLVDRGFSRSAQQLIVALRAHLAQAMAGVYLGEE